MKIEKITEEILQTCKDQNLKICLETGIASHHLTKQSHKTNKRLIEDLYELYLAGKFYPGDWFEIFQFSRKNTILEKFRYYGFDVSSKSKRDLRSLYPDRVKEARIATNIERFGAAHPTTLPEIQERMKSTMIERYGVDSPMRSKEIQERMKSTMLERYGVENSSRSEISMQKRRQTNLEKYGVESYLQTEEFKARAKETCLQKYGVTHHRKDEGVQEKARRTNLEKYGVPNVMQSNEVREKAKETMLSRYGTDKPGTLSSRRFLIRNCYCEPENVDNFILERVKFIEEMKETKQFRNFSVTEKDKAFEFVKTFGRSSRLIYAKSLLDKKRKESSLEMLLVPIIEKLCNEFGLSYSRNARSEHGIIWDKTPMELDFLISGFPNGYRLAVEANGSFWHSIESGMRKEYHFEKRKKCENNGIKLLGFMEDQIPDEKFVESAIRATILKLLNPGYQMHGIDENLPVLFTSQSESIEEIPTPCYIVSQFFTSEGYEVWDYGKFKC